MMSNVENGIFRYLMLSQMQGFGSVTQGKLIRLCGGIEACFEWPLEQMMEKTRAMRQPERISDKRLQTFCTLRTDGFLKQKAETIMDQSRNAGIDIITREDPQYPLRFSGITDMPMVLYIKGQLCINAYERSAAVIGARRCTKEDKQEAIIITKTEVTGNSAIISGMAKGIDSYAHTAALKSGGYTIAVLGNGPDHCYPAEHRYLYEQIMDRGCILSEYPPQIKPRNYMFPQRNRLIAALSDIIYVIGAGRNSGTETTVEAGQKYGREIVTQSSWGTVE